MKKRLSCIKKDIHPRGNMARNNHGFTLLEVLVATAIVGIALGVLLGGFAMGHRQAFRGDITREAASIARDLLNEYYSETEIPDSDEGEVRDHPGWRFRMELQGLKVAISHKDTKPVEIEVPELRKMIIEIIPPASPPLRLITWIPSTNERP